jgi:RNA polymerase sigma factor (sigma-70 family)
VAPLLEERPPTAVSGLVRRAQHGDADAFAALYRQHVGRVYALWLHRVAVNVVLTALRTEQRRHARVRPVADLTPFDTGTRPAAPDAAMDLEEAIAALPPQARAVLVLHEIEGYRHAEIAALMGIATGTSKAHLHRARRLLQEMLRR